MRAGERADHALAQVGRLEPRVGQEMLDVFDHRPFEEDFAGFVIVSQAALDLVAAWGAADPDVVGSRRAEGRRAAGASRRRRLASPARSPGANFTISSSQRASSSQS